MKVMLRPGDQVPHVSFRTTDGHALRYADLWQHKNLILVSLPADSAFGTYAARLEHDLRSGLPADTSLVISHDALADLPAPAILVADKWGEIHYAYTASTLAEMPVAESILEWLTYVRVQCPECQGETK
jgi:peroxiredoxin